jgi:parvulin-like peptidyl-prolyl isomerase
MKKILVTTAAIIFTCLPLCLNAQMQTSHQPTAEIASRGEPPQAQIACVNGVLLTQAQLNEELQLLFPYYSIHGGRVPPSAEAELRQRAMQNLVLHELVYQEARRRGLRVPELTWQKRLRQLRQGFDSKQAYEAAATKKYGSVAEFEHRLRRSMLIEQLWDIEVTRKSLTTVDAARAYYSSHKAKYVRPDAIWLQTITVKFPKNATAEQKKMARNVGEQILVKANAAKNYEEFGRLAEQLSQDDWRVMMGDHNWVHRGSVTSDIEPTLFALKVGETSGLVESSEGYLIMRANDRQTSRQMSFAEMSAPIRQQLEKDKSTRRSKELEMLLRSKAKIDLL